MTNPSHRSKHDRTRITREKVGANENTETDGFDAGDVFNRIWQQHPKKTGRYVAERALVEVLAAAPDPEELAGRIEEVHRAWCQTEDWQKQNGRYAPQLHRWLTDRGWLDGAPQRPADEEPVVPCRPYWEVEAESHG